MTLDTIRCPRIAEQFQVKNGHHRWGLSDMDEYIIFQAMKRAIEAMQAEGGRPSEDFKAIFERFRSVVEPEF